MGSSKAPQQLRELLAAMLLAGAAAPGASPGPKPRAATPDCALRHYQSEAQLKLGHDLASCIARSQSSAGSLPRHLPRAQPGSGGGRAQWTRCLAGTPYAQLRVQTCLVRPSSDPFFGPASVGGQPRLRALAAALSLCRATAPPPPPSSAVVEAAPAARRRHSTVVERPRASGSGGLLSHLRFPFWATLARGAAPPRGPPAPGVRGWTRASGCGTSGGGGDALPGVHAAGAAAAAPAAAGGTAQLNPSAVHSLQRLPASGAAVVDAPPPPHPPPPPPPPIGTSINVNALRSALLHGRRFSLPERWQQQQQQQQLAPAGAVHMCASPLATSARPTAPSMQAHAQYPPAPTGASTVAATLGGAGAAGSVLSAAGACRGGLVPQPPAPRHPGARRPV